MENNNSRVQTILKIFIELNNKIISTCDIDVAIDTSVSGNVVGIEILNFKHQTNSHVLDELDNTLIDTGLTYSFDDEVDAFYLTISDENISDQRPVFGKAFLDENGRLVSLEVILS